MDRPSPAGSLVGVSFVALAIRKDVWHIPDFSPSNRSVFVPGKWNLRTEFLFFFFFAPSPPVRMILPPPDMDNENGNCSDAQIANRNHNDFNRSDLKLQSASKATAIIASKSVETKVEIATEIAVIRIAEVSNR